MCCSKVSAVALAGSGVTVRNRSSDFAAQNLFGIWDVADTCTKLVFDVFPAPNLSILEPDWRRFWYKEGSLMQCLSVSWCLRSGLRNPRAYPDFMNT